MDKNELINILVMAVELEEGHVPVVAKFLLDDFDWGDLENEKMEKAKNILSIIKNQSAEHANMINDILTYVRSSNKNEI